MSVFFAASPNANETASQCHSVAASAEKRRGLSTLEARILLSLRLQYSSRQIAVFSPPARKARNIFENNSKKPCFALLIFVPLQCKNKCGNRPPDVAGRANLML